MAIKFPIKYLNLLRHIYCYLKDRFFVPAIGLMAHKFHSKNVVCQLGNYGNSFSTYQKGRYYVNIDRQNFFRSISPESSSLTVKEYPDISNASIKLGMGLFYHEMGHVCFSAFNIDKVLAPVPDEDKYLVQQLWNILEDPLVEGEIMKLAKKSKIYFAYLKEKLFSTTLDDYEDDGTCANFLNYLLLALRFGVKAIKNDNEFFDNHKEKIQEYVQKYYAEKNGEKRNPIAVEFYEYLKSKGMDFKMEMPEGEVSSVPCSKGGGAPAPSGTSGSEVPKGFMPGAGKEKGKGDEDEDGSGGSGKGKDEDDESKDSDVDMDTTAGDYDIPTKEGFESYDTLASDLSTHEFAKVDDIFSPGEKVLTECSDYYSESVNKFTSTIAGVMDKIDAIQSINVVRQMSGFQSGRFSVKSYVRGADILKCFSRPSGPELDPDLTFYLLVDQSGSMGGDKSRICTQALIMLYESLARLDIPFELSCFTNTGDHSGTHCLTYVIKDFDDDAELRKKFVPFCDDRFASAISEGRCSTEGYPVFYGNYDEVNVAFVGQKLLSRLNKNKVLIVLSDGQTCGSMDRLIERIKALEEKNVLCLGIGIEDHTVEKIYDKNVVFNSTAQLEALPEFLGNFLADLYK